MGIRESRRLWATLLAGAAFAPACADDANLARVRPHLVTDPEPGLGIGFDEVVLGRDDPRDEGIRVRNEGAGRLVISSVTVDRAGRRGVSGAERATETSRPVGEAASSCGSHLRRPARWRLRCGWTRNDPDRPEVDVAADRPRPRGLLGGRGFRPISASSSARSGAWRSPR